MIDELRAMAIFQAVAEAGSFRGAAKKLGLSPSVVSHHVTQFETRLGTPLLYRSTRRVSLTDAGAELLGASQSMSRAAQEGLAAINRRVSQPQGRLSITLNTASSHQPAAAIYTSFAKAYPQIQLSLHITDHYVELEGSPYDLAIRGSARGLDDSSYKATRIGSVQLCMMASPKYASQHPPAKTLDDLATWDRVQFPPVGWATYAKLAGLPVPRSDPRIAVTCDNFQMALSFVQADLGFCIEWRKLVEDDFASGKLVEVLPGTFAPKLDIFAIYPANAPADSPARLFVEHMKASATQWA